VTGVQRCALPIFKEGDGLLTLAEKMLLKEFRDIGKLRLSGHI
jgi:hypothetical protein